MSWPLAYWWIPPLVTVAGMIPLFLYLERRRREAYEEFCLMRGFTFERSRHSSPQPYAAVPLLVAPARLPKPDDLDALLAEGDGVRRLFLER